ncbi:MAG: peptidase U32 family protein [Christensenellales bacterium]|jgi:putative protease
MKRKDVELLAPAGDMEKLKTAIEYGADAVYFAGKRFGLRALSANFDKNELKEAIEFAHSKGVKCYITVNIIAHNSDFIGLADYIKELEELKADAVIIADLGIASLVKEVAPNLELHVSTQASITNIHTALAWVKLGAKRLVLARELSLQEIRQIKQALPEDVTLETFVHGSMCISYSGRCLLSNYFTGRDSNRGLCTQPCRWGYQITPVNNENKKSYPIEEDERGTYILNSKDMCLVEHLEELYEAGITSFKIEGRMKTPYYLATVVNAYNRRLIEIENRQEPKFDWKEELAKTSNREFTTGFYFGEDNKQNYKQSGGLQTHTFVALVLQDAENGYCLVEQRNRFKLGDELEVLSPDENFNQIIKVEQILKEDQTEIDDAKGVQEKLYLKTNLNLKQNSILRKRAEK